MGYSGSPINLYSYCKNPLSHVDVLGLHDPEDAAPPKTQKGEGEAQSRQEGTEPAAEGSPTPPSDGLARATAARDAALAEIKALPSKQRNQVATVVGAHDPATGQVAVGVKRSGTDHGKCAEDLAAEALGNPDPKSIEFTPVIRPRNDDTIPRCERCTETFGPEER